MYLYRKFLHFKDIVIYILHLPPKNNMFPKKSCLPESIEAIKIGPI